MKCVNRTEQDLHRECVRHYLVRGWVVVAHEWIVIPRKEAYGRGDLVFRRGKEYRVIECKRKPHPNVFEQARFYGAAWKMLYAKSGYSVRYGVWTCSVKKMLGTVVRPVCLRKRACAEIQKKIFSIHK